MSDWMNTYKELLGQTRACLASMADEGLWVHLSSPEIAEFFKSTPRAVPVAPQKAPLPPPAAVPVQRATPPPVVSKSMPVREQPTPPVAAPAPVVMTPAPKKDVSAETPTVPVEEPETVGKPFALTPVPTIPPIDLTDFKKLIANFAPALRLIDGIPSKVTTSIHHVPEGAIALILTPNHISTEVNTFLQAVAKAVELRFGPCGILDSHGLVSAKQAFPPPGPRLIPIADPTIYLREPQRKAELWNDIRRKLGKPAPRP